MSEKAQTIEQVSSRPRRQAQSTPRQAPEGPIASPWNLQQALLDPTRAPARAVLALQRKVGNRELSNLLTKVRRDIASSQQVSASSELESGSAGQAFTDSPLAMAARGLSGPSEPLPFYRAIQQAFGRHDLSQVRAHQGPAARTAARALGATAFAMGEKLAFQERPDLFTAAHEAAHVIQQRGGNVPAGGVGKEHDRYEQQADQVASAVVRGQHVEGLLGPVLSTRGSAAALQLKKMKELFANEIQDWKSDWEHRLFNSTLEELYSKLRDEHEADQELVKSVGAKAKCWKDKHKPDGDKPDKRQRYEDKKAWVDRVWTKSDLWLAPQQEHLTDHRFSSPSIKDTFASPLEQALTYLPSELKSTKFIFLTDEYFKPDRAGFFSTRSGNIAINATNMMDDRGALTMHRTEPQVLQLSWTVAHESGHKFDHDKNLIGPPAGYLQIAGWEKVEGMDIDRLIEKCKQLHGQPTQDPQFINGIRDAIRNKDTSNEKRLLDNWHSDGNAMEDALWSWISLRKDFEFRGGIPSRWRSSKILTEHYNEWWLYDKEHRKLHAVSEYSFAHPKEWFAEAFACYMVDKNRLKTIDEQAHNFIQRKLPAGFRTKKEQELLLQLELLLQQSEQAQTTVSALAS